MKRNVIETIMGAVVLVVAIGFMLFAYDKGDVEPIEGYEVLAAFSDATGINSGTEVRLGGVKIGVVNDLRLDEQTYQAKASLQIRDGIKLPKDSSAAIMSSGLLGDKFVGIEPGAEDDMLSSGDEIKFTQSSVSIEELIGKFVFSGGGVEGDGDDVASSSDEPEAGSVENPFSVKFE